MKIAYEEAKLIAENALTSFEEVEGVRVEIVERNTVETANGWVFFWNSSDYLRTGNISDALAGNGPIFVSNDGRAHFMPSHKSWQEAIKGV